MLSVFPCHSREDSQFARDLSEFLERGTSVQVFLEDSEIAPGETLVAKALDGLEASVILLLLSPASVPARWVRPEWEPALREGPRRAGVSTATVLVRDCGFPPLFRREAFFDLTQNRLEGFRLIKRWLLGLEPVRKELEFEPARQGHFVCRDAEMERLKRELADAPGVALLTGSAPGAGKTTMALEFARQSKRDFEGLVWLSCAGQSLASLAGEMASQLGLVLEGDLEQNLRDLSSFCVQRRLLIVLDDAQAAAKRLISNGRTSILLTTPAGDVCTQIGCVPIVIDPIDGQVLRRKFADLGMKHRHLVAAACACGNQSFRPLLVSEMAGLDLKTAGELLQELVASGLMLQLDLRYHRYVMHSIARSMAHPLDTMARAHARAIARSFLGWANEESKLEADLPQLLHALDWALSRDRSDDAAWALACDLAKRGVALLKRKRRQAEAFELLGAISRAAERREDHRALEHFSRDQVWMLESWGRLEEAQTIFHKRRAIFNDQMCFNFE